MQAKSKLYRWYQEVGPFAVKIVQHALGHKSTKSIYRVLKQYDLTPTEATRIEQEIVRADESLLVENIPPLQRYDLSSICRDCPHRARISDHGN